MHALYLVLVLIFPAGKSVGEDVSVSTANPAPAGMSLEGAGISRPTASGATSASYGGDKKSVEVKKLDELFIPCKAADIGTDSLWKFPSESWRDGAAFIPPQQACKTRKVLDAGGRETGGFEVARYRVASMKMCADIACQQSLAFDKMDLREFCAWRVRKSTWKKKFGDDAFKVVMMLQDGRFLVWDIAEPTVRNGMPPYRNIQRKSPPACYRLKFGQ